MNSDITASELLQRCWKVAYKERLKEKRQKRIVSLVLILGLAGSVGAAGNIKPKPIKHEPCCLAGGYINELSASEAKIKKLEQELKKEKAKPKEKVKKTIDTHPVSFYKAVRITFKHEGGRGIDNNGYKVNYGINQLWYTPLKGYPKSVWNLTRTQAIEYARVNYWLPLRLNGQHSEAYEAFIFDTAFNKSVVIGQKINQLANGDLEVAKKARLGHLKAWRAGGRVGTCGKACYSSLVERVNTYKEV
jgi:hypothetical protein